MMRSGARAAMLAGAAMAAFPLAVGMRPVAAQQQFRAGADTVPVYVTVRDREGGFVGDLSRDDFELRDNGVMQEITQFTTDVQPLSVLILIDGSASMLPEFDRAIEGATSFVVRLLPHDRARIGSFAERIRFGPRFTSDRDELLAYLADEFNLIIGPETHLWEALLEGSMALAEEPGKRVVIAISDGYNFVMPAGASAGPGGLIPGGGTGGRGPTGRPGPPGIGNPFGGRPPAGVPGGGRGPTGTGGRPMPPGPVSLSDPATTGVPADSARAAALQRNVILYAVSMWVRTGEARGGRPSRDLERLALDTGGGFFEADAGADMTTTFGRIIQELRQQYVLGFAPKTFEGRSHRLDVRVKRPGVQVNARRSYVAERAR